MKKIIVEPEGWPCRLGDCPPGFFMFGEELCFKSGYNGMETVGDTEVPGPEMRWKVGMYSDVYCGNGSAFWGGVSKKKDRENLEVKPVLARWEEE